MGDSGIVHLPTPSSCAEMHAATRSFPPTAPFPLCVNVMLHVLRTFCGRSHSGTHRNDGHHDMTCACKTRVAPTSRMAALGATFHGFEHIFDYLTARELCRAEV